MSRCLFTGARRQDDFNSTHTIKVVVSFWDKITTFTFNMFVKNMSFLNYTLHASHNVD